MKYARKILLLWGISFLVNAQKFSVILGRPTDKSMTLSVLFDQNIEYQIEYGTQSGSYPNKTSLLSESANIPKEFDLEGLSKNTRYFYRLQYRLKGELHLLHHPSIIL